MFVTNWNSTTKIQKISEITNFFRHYFLSRTEVNIRSVGTPLYIINIHTELAPVCEDCIKKTNTLRERSISDYRKQLPSLRVFFDGTRESYGYYQEYSYILLGVFVYTIRRKCLYYQEKSPFISFECAFKSVECTFKSVEHTFNDAEWRFSLMKKRNVPRGNYFSSRDIPFYSSV